MHSADCDEPRPTEMLFGEHRVIERVLHALDVLARTVRDGDAVPVLEPDFEVSARRQSAERESHEGERQERADTHPLHDTPHAQYVEVIRREANR